MELITTIRNVNDESKALPGGAPGMTVSELLASGLGAWAINYETKRLDLKKDFAPNPTSASGEGTSRGQKRDP